MAGAGVTLPAKRISLRALPLPGYHKREHGMSAPELPRVQSQHAGSKGVPQTDNHAVEPMLLDTDQQKWSAHAKLQGTAGLYSTIT